MMADKGERGVVGVAESILFDKNDDHAPRGWRLRTFVVLCPGIQGIAASRRFPRLRLRNEVFSTRLSVCDQPAGRGRLVGHAVPVATRCFSSSPMLRRRRHVEPFLEWSMTSVLQGRP